MTSQSPAKVSITLTGLSNWQEWFRLIKRHADQYKLWPYIDPDSEEKALLRPEKPAVATVKKDATELNELDSAEKMLYIELLLIWKEDIKQWDKTNDRLEALHTTILSSVSSSILNSIANQDSPHALLKTLKIWYASSDEELILQLKDEYDDAFKTLSPQNRQPKQILKWIEKLQDVRRRCDDKKINRVQDPRDPIRDLLNAIQPLKESFYDQWWPRFKDQEDLSFDKILLLFKDKYSTEARVSPKEEPLEASFATFKGDSSKATDPTTSAKRKKDPIPEDKRCILCAYPYQEHGPENCLYTIPSLRFHNFRMNSNVMKRVEKELAARPEVQKLVDRINREKATSNSATSVLAPVALLTMSSQPASFNTLSNYTLKKSTIADNTLHVHVCNDTANISNFRKNTEGTYLMVGNTRIKIIGYADFTIQAKKPDSEDFPVVLKNAYYIPDFHTNLLSLSTAKKSDVFYNARKRMLEMGDGTPFCRV